MAEKLVILDYESGNLRSVEKSVQRAAREHGMALNVEVVSKADKIAEADRVILPGVGAFGACMDGLKAVPGGIEALEHAVLARGRPFLGICVGMQLLADRGLEFGERAGLGWIAGSVKPLVPAPGFRVPHMGWNSVTVTGSHPALNHGHPGIDAGVTRDDRRDEDFYFVHSYHFDVENDAHLLGTTDYNGSIAAIVGRDNILGVQFHPEKSQSAGLAFLANFLGWKP